MWRRVASGFSAGGPDPGSRPRVCFQGVQLALSSALFWGGARGGFHGEGRCDPLERRQAPHPGQPVSTQRWVGWRCLPRGWDRFRSWKTPGPEPEPRRQHRRPWSCVVHAATSSCCSPSLVSLEDLLLFSFRSACSRGEATSSACALYTDTGWRRGGRRGASVDTCFLGYIVPGVFVERGVCGVLVAQAS